MNAQLKLPVPAAIPAWDALPHALTWKEKVAYLGFKLGELPQSDCPVEHIIGHGMYVRKMRIPAGTLFLGRAHLKGHQCTLLSGSLVLVTPQGKRYVDAPMTIHTHPGYHMVLFALTDVVGQTVHPNPDNSTDTDALEAGIFESVVTLKEIGMQVDERLRLT